MDDEARKKALWKLEGTNDPLRVMILTALTRKPSSANDLAARLNLPIGKIRYQLGRLRKAGLAELRAQRPRRGVIERVYVSRLDFLSVEDVAYLSEEELNRGHVEILKAMVRDCLAAFEAGTFMSREDFIAARVPTRLDAEGWRQASELQHETLDRLLEIHAASAARIEERGEPSILAMSFLFLFEAAPGP